jgi:hypothetical protein
MRQIVIAAAAIAAVTVGHAYADGEQYPAGPFFPLHSAESTTAAMGGQSSAARTNELARSGWKVATLNPRGSLPLVVSDSAYAMPTPVMARSTDRLYFQSQEPRGLNARLDSDVSARRPWTNVNSGGGEG